MGHPNEAESRGHPIVSSLACTERHPRKRMMPVDRVCARPFLAGQMAIAKVNLLPSRSFVSDKSVAN
jgi:hypothetical protein